MKKITALFTAILLCMTVFSGCGKKEASSGGTDKITIWSNNSHSKNFYVKKVEEFNSTVGKENGIEIEYVVKDNAEQAIELSFLSDQAPDFMVGGNTEKLVGEGYLMPFEELEGGEEYIAKYKDFLVEDRNVFDGKTYSIPLNTTTMALVYNKEMFVDAGIVDENGEAKPPETWDELIEDAKLLTNEDKKQYGIIFDAKDSWWWGTDVNQVGVASGAWIDGYNCITGKFDYTVHAEIMKKLMQIKKDGSFVPGAEGLTNDAARARFAAGNVGMKTAYSFDYAVLTDQFPAKIDWGVAELPVLDKNEKHWQFLQNSNNFCMNRASAEKYGAEKMLLIYDYFQNDDFIKEMYTNCVGLPYDYSIIEGVECDDERWESFGKMLKISRSSTGYKIAECDTTGITSIVTTWSEIWAGKITDIDAAMQEYSDQKNAGIERYCEAHPDYVLPETAPADYSTVRSE